MQLMTWMIGRLGSRFSFQFEPYHRRVMHSALGRFMDRPLDLAVGLVEPDGRQRVLPFTTDNDDAQVDQFANCEQFDRHNSITFRGYSERFGLRFEMNVHSVFYPQNERLCLMPAFYLEMRVNPLRRFRLMKPVGPSPGQVEMFIRLRREQTQITTQDNAIHLAYDTPLRPIDPWASREEIAEATYGQGEPQTARAEERVVSLNPGCTPSVDGNGLRLVLPVTASGSGIKWRLVWAAHVADPVLRVREGRPTGHDTASEGHRVRDSRFRYTTLWPDVDAVAKEAVDRRDERLALSRRFEKVLEQAPLDASQRHLTNQTFQNFRGQYVLVHHGAPGPGGPGGNTGGAGGMVQRVGRLAAVPLFDRRGIQQRAVLPRVLAPAAETADAPMAGSAQRPRAVGRQHRAPRPGPGTETPPATPIATPCRSKKTPTCCCSSRPTPAGPATARSSRPTSKPSRAWCVTSSGPTATPRASPPRAWPTPWSMRCPRCATAASRPTSRSSGSPRCAPPRGCFAATTAPTSPGNASGSSKSIPARSSRWPGWAITTP